MNTMLTHHVRPETATNVIKTGMQHLSGASIPPAKTQSDVAVCVVVPIYKHPGLLGETLASALAQHTNFKFAIALVNDGCPYAETDLVCQEFAARYPGIVFYIHKRNGGLSSARNTGINFALQAFAGLEAVYLLDADNIILNRSLQKFLDCLRSSGPDIGWIYPDIDKFGLPEFASMRGGYSSLEHICWNYCEAGSLIKASVLRGGLRFDESMRAGYEDWEFWLQCIDAGYAGRHLPYSGFKYRQRSESMLKDSERRHESIVSYIRQKHAALFSPRSLVEKESASCGRYAIFCRDSYRAYYATDTTKPWAEVDNKQFVRDAVQSHVAAEFMGVPPLMVMASEAALDLLKDVKLLPGILWAMQRHVGASGMVLLTIEVSVAPTVQFSLSGPSAQTGMAHLAMVSTTTMLEASETLQPDDPDWAGLSQTALNLSLRLPHEPPKFVPVGRFVGEMRSRLSDSLKLSSRLGLVDTEVQVQRRRLCGVASYAREITSVEHILPMLKEAGKPDIGFLLPVMSFGGVEKVAYAYARTAHGLGARVHFFTNSRMPAVLPADVLAMASSITMFRPDEMEVFAAPDRGGAYLGAPVPKICYGPERGDAIGLLCLMDSVINFNAVAFNTVMADLRRFGVKTLTSQHLIDITPFGQPQGTPHQALAYEHAYDKFVVISDQMKAWFVGMGVPSAKLMVIRNGPGFEMTKRQVSAALARRLGRSGGALRVLFLGRFDHQKGLDRLCRIVQRAVAEGQAMEWRVVGRPILGDGAVDLEPIRQFVHPAAMDARSVMAHYQWADVLILPSRSEGVPLSIIEAGMLGCIPMATRVGAIAEIVSDGETGFLIEATLSEQAVEKAFYEQLVALSCDREIMQTISLRTARSFENQRWPETTFDLMAFLDLTRESAKTLSSDNAS